MTQTRQLAAIMPDLHSFSEGGPARDPSRKAKRPKLQRRRVHHFITIKYGYRMTATRQLAAIMFTDIVGYTALMGKDSNKALELGPARQTNPETSGRAAQWPLVKGNGGWSIKM